MMAAAGILHAEMTIAPEQGFAVDAGWFDDEVEAALEADRLSEIPVASGVTPVAQVARPSSHSVSYVAELFAVPEGSDDLAAPAARANDNVEHVEASVSSSHLRVRPSAEVEVVQRFLEEIGGAQFSLTMRLNELDRVASNSAPNEATEVARAALDLRIAELDHLRDALNDLYLEAAAPEVADALAQDGVFTEYLRGVYAWAEALLRALEVLNVELTALKPDWFRMRSRINDARDFYLANLEDDVRGAIEALNRGSHPEAKTLIRDLGTRVDAVIVTSRTLLGGVSRRFA